MAGTCTLNNSPFCVSVVFCFLVRFLFSFSYSPHLLPLDHNYQRDLFCHIFNRFCRHQPWCGLNSSFTDISELKMKTNDTRGTCQSPSLGLCSFRSERISWDDAETMQLGLEPMVF